MILDVYENHKRDDDVETLMSILSSENFSLWKDVSWDDDIFNAYLFWDRDISYYSGASKVCFIFHDFVLKMGFAGEACEVEENENLVLRKEEKYLSYDCVGSKYEFDSMEIEYDLYCEAKRRGLEYFFAETERVSDNLYVQERADCSLNESDELYEWGSDASCNEAIIAEYNLGYLFNLVGSTVFSLFLDKYTEEELSKLSAFLEEFEINDLHEGNIGFFGEELKLFDFCGYETNTPIKIKSKI